MKIGYVRVSTEEQNEALQMDARDARQDARSSLPTRVLGTLGESLNEFERELLLDSKIGTKIFG